MLKRKGKIVVGNERELREVILLHFHSSSVGGHSGINATYQRVCTIFYWKKLWKTIREFVRHCEVCHRYKLKLVAPLGLLQP